MSELPRGYFSGFSATALKQTVANNAKMIATTEVIKELKR